MLTGREKRQINMLEGSLWDKILLFALPLAMSSILQQLFNAADVAVVGRFSGSEALAAVGANGPIINLVVGTFAGLSVGTNAVAAVMLGRREEKELSKVVHTSISIAVIIGVILAVAGWFIAAPILKLMSMPEEIFDLAVTYLKIYFLGMPFILIYNFAAAILRAKGDTKRPLISLISAGIVNVILNIVLVAVCDLNVAGVAIATFVSNLISSGILIYFLIKEEESIRLRVRDMKIDIRILKEIAKIGLPAGLQGIVFSVSNICIQSALNKLGADAVAATSAVVNYEYFAYYMISAFGQTVITFIGQNYGAGQWKRCTKVIRWCLLLGGIFTVLLNGMFVLFSREFAGIFTSDPVVIEMGMFRMRMILSFELINNVIEIMSGSMRGFGYSLEPALVCMMGVCGVRLIWLYTVFSRTPTYQTLLTVYPISWSITAVVLVISYFVIKQKIGKREGSEAL